MVKICNPTTQGVSKVALIGSKPPHPRLLKSVLPVWRSRATPATRSFTLFGDGGEEEKDV